MGRDRAAYMREYRAKEKRARQNVTAVLTNSVPELVVRIRELEEEVRYLKAELAKRPVMGIFAPDEAANAIVEQSERFNSRPFTPVPKKGK